MPEPTPLNRATSRLTAFILGARGPDKLPDRIRTDVSNQQIQSERLIAWVQLCIVAFFGTFYYITPKTSDGTEFMPVPWVLGAYGLFTIIRLAALHRNAANRFVVLLSVVMDMLLLMGLIWSFHVQYGQPASFYLKAPTLLYVFIFIALRALRFDPVYVLTAGLAAAVGWIGLLGYALFLDDMRIAEQMPITRDYVHYMTSHKILIGAEVDKIVSILVVTLILALVLIRARRTLERAVSQGAAAASLSRFVSEDVVRQVTEGETDLQPGSAEERVATVLFTDIERFSTISEKVTPSQLMDMLNDYFETVGTVLERHDGLVAQFVGDAMMVVFRNKDAPDAVPCATRAVAAAREITETLNGKPFGSLQIPINTRCGLNTGLMTLGAVGSRDRLIFTAHGDEVNVAARLEQLNKTYGTYILMSEATMQRAKLEDGNSGTVRHMDDIIVRGRSAPTPIYTIDPPTAQTTTAAPPSSAQRALPCAVNQDPVLDPIAAQSIQSATVEVHPQPEPQPVPRQSQG